MSDVFLSLGSNLGDRLAFLEQALAELAKRYSITGLSSVYETVPQGKTDQPDYLNLVVRLAVDHSPEELLEVIQSIENHLGRVRSVRWGERTIDIDILFFDDITRDTKTLEIPHPRLWERAFVLIPLLELAPEYAFQGRKLADCLARLGPQGVRKYAEITADR